MTLIIGTDEIIAMRGGGMTRDETVQLWQACEDARAAASAAGQADDQAHEAAKAVWNKWAERLQDQQANLMQNGQWMLEAVSDYNWPEARQRGSNPMTQAWLQSAFVDFAGHRFENGADFSGFLFPGDVDFGRQSPTKGKEIPTVFCEYASFTSAQFKGSCRFSWANFRKRSWFDRAEFSGYAQFTRTQFSERASFRSTNFSTAYFAGTHFQDDAWFHSAKFRGRVQFYGATFNFAVFEFAVFEKLASFDHAVFDKFIGFKEARFLGEPASFDGIVTKGAISFYSTYFEKLPDFNQAVFSGVPRLDYVKFGSKLQRDRFWESIFGSKRGLEHEAAKYRALRGLAIAAHDYENEARAFKGEIRSRRGTDHRAWDGVYWVGLFYDVLSDFGRSIMRPALAWLLSIPAFAIAYLADAGRLLTATATCTDGSSPVWMKSAVFALKNSILFVNWDREQIRSAYACLYDQPASQADLVVPTTNALIQVGQSVWSAVLIFLFLLAVRNQFKIR
jgi:uncharacterized protein YjbI with pentapeptide repeats